MTIGLVAKLKKKVIQRIRFKKISIFNHDYALKELTLKNRVRKIDQYFIHDQKKWEIM